MQRGMQLRQQIVKVWQFVNRNFPHCFPDHNFQLQLILDSVYKLLSNFLRSGPGKRKKRLRIPLYPQSFLSEKFEVAETIIFHRNTNSYLFLDWVKSSGNCLSERRELPHIACIFHTFLRENFGDNELSVASLLLLGRLRHLMWRPLTWEKAEKQFINRIQHQLKIEKLWSGKRWMKFRLTKWKKCHSLLPQCNSYKLCFVG